jgi:cytochrome c-type biogenesis protein CcmF
LRKDGKVKATVYPRIQINPGMGGFIASPDIVRNLSADLYSHVSLPMNPEADPEWSKTEDVQIKIGEEFFVNDYVARLEDIKRIDKIEGVTFSDRDAAVEASIKIQGEHEVYEAKPVFIIKDASQVGYLPFEVNDLGVKLTLTNIHPATNEFTFGINTRQKDWVVIKALEKPYINIMWIGTIILMIGFALAFVRRYKEFREAKKEL